MWIRTKLCSTTGASFWCFQPLLSVPCHARICKLNSPPGPKSDQAERVIWSTEAHLPPILSQWQSALVQKPQLLKPICDPVRLPQIFISNQAWALSRHFQNTRMSCSKSLLGSKTCFSQASLGPLSCDELLVLAETAVHALNTLSVE